MIRTRRTKGNSDRFVHLKAAIFFLGAGTWIAGVVMEDSRVTGAAIVMLAVGVLLRVLGAARRRREVEDQSEDAPPQ